MQVNRKSTGRVDSNIEICELPKLLGTMRLAEMQLNADLKFGRMCRLDYDHTDSMPESRLAFAFLKFDTIKVSTLKLSLACKASL